MYIVSVATIARPASVSQMLIKESLTVHTICRHRLYVSPALLAGTVHHFPLFQKPVCPPVYDEYLWQKGIAASTQ